MDAQTGVAKPPLQNVLLKLVRVAVAVRLPLPSVPLVHKTQLHAARLPFSVDHRPPAVIIHPVVLLKVMEPTVANSVLKAATQTTVQTVATRPAAVALVVVAVAAMDMEMATATVTTNQQVCSGICSDHAAVVAAFAPAIAVNTAAKVAV